MTNPKVDHDEALRLAPVWADQPEGSVTGILSRAYLDLARRIEELEAQLAVAHKIERERWESAKSLFQMRSQPDD